MMHVFVGKPAQGEELKWENSTLEELLALATTSALFGGARAFVLEGALGGERQEEFLNAADGFVDSPHTFIFVEEKLLAAPTRTLEKAGAKITVVKKAVVKVRGFDPFGLTAALGARDRKKLWLAIGASLRAGEKAEAIAGLLAWKARAMRDAQLSRTLVCLYHDSHRGAGDLELLLERFALTL